LGKCSIRQGREGVFVFKFKIIKVIELVGDVFTLAKVGDGKKNMAEVDYNLIDFLCRFCASNWIKCMGPNMECSFANI